ncbi:MAG: choice-of-anchor tandem repeat GloVer-containing protein [Bryobacteraceae bacterium]|jgi:uncharacterized repeat protein (TIGR03803 family)
MQKPNWCENLGMRLVLWAVTAMALSAQTFTTLESFDGTNGAGPAYISLVQGFNASLYGTTLLGGSSGNGTVFTISRTDAFASLTSSLNGIQPISGLVLAPSGEFYGTTYFGGPHGAGEVFKMSASGDAAALYGFCPSPQCPDGENPVGGLVLATNGDLYGTATFGGANDAGTLFKLTQSGTYTTLYSFCIQANCADGSQPQGTLIQATNGRIYGTTNIGGTAQGGTVFEITPSGALGTVHEFCSMANCADGTSPIGGLIQGTDGNLYGTTQFGGVLPGGEGGSGTVYKINPATNSLTTLYVFCRQPYCTDGESPFGALVEGTDGNFYGTTWGGGAANAGGSYSLTAGTVFQLTPQGVLTTLHSFCTESGCPDGFDPEGALTQSTNGAFYGTTCGGACGGTSGDGTVFKLSMGLHPFVRTVPTAGEVGAQIRILGSDLTGATSVTFNGTAAAFTVTASSLITATVPAGATTGRVRVVIPEGTLTSNAAFQVE